MNPIEQKNVPGSCDHRRLQSFLDSEQYRLDDAELIEHLDACPACRSLLESSAADDDVWQNAGELLKPDEFDQPSATASSPTTTGGYAGHRSTAVRDVLQSLAPSDYPDRLGRLGPYEVTGVVGFGGMGVVLKAIDPSLERVVAVKVMSPRLANSESARKRFAREARAAAAVLHPNVIPIHSVSTSGSMPYLVMAYIRGASLQKRLENEGPLQVVEILRIGSQIAAGLDAAHQQGLVHRDIKPENILLEDGVERVTITDFGLARAVDDNTVTQFGSIAGTPMYMSPEQARGEQVDQQSDLFSMGSLLYALCTGRPPFRDDTSYGVMRKIIDESPTSIEKLNPATPQWMIALVEQLMAKRKEDRFASAREVHSLLEACLSHVQQPSSSPLPAILQIEPQGRTMLSIRATILGTAAIILLFFGAFVLHQFTQPYSAQQFGPLLKGSYIPFAQLSPEQPSETVGRVTIGDPERLLGSWKVAKVPLHWSIQGKSDRIGETHSFAKNYYTLGRVGVASTQGEWRLSDTDNPRRIILSLDGVERKALYKLEGDYLSLYYRNGETDFPKSFPSALSYFDPGVLLILEHWAKEDVAYEYSDVTVEEATLIAKHPANVSLPNLAELTPDVAGALATGTSNLSLPAVTELSLDVARALATKKSIWLILRGLQTISPEVAVELAKSECALDLGGIQELSPEAAVALVSRSRGLSLSGMSSISPKVASALVAGDYWLNLSTMKSLDTEIATILSQHGGWLSLDGLESITQEAAEALARFRGTNLDLNGIQTLDVETAEAIAGAKPSTQFSLNGLKTLSPEVAAALVAGGHRHLSLQGLETLPDESLKILRRHQRRLIEGRTGEMLLPAKFDLPTND